MRKLALGLVVPMLSIALSWGAHAASGTALGVNPQAEAQKAGDRRVLVVGADVAIGERIITGDRGLVQIKFSDKTELTVGPRSSLVIEDYLLRDDGSAGKLAINALAGTFRFVTGGAPKDRYLITTPTGTIGVRGTELDFNVTPAATSVLVFRGTVILCNLSGTCVTLDDFCELGEASTPDSVILGLTNEMSRSARDALRTLFPYAQSQSALLAAFRVEQARLCLNPPPTSPPAFDRVTTSAETQDGGGDDCGWEDYSFTNGSGWGSGHGEGEGSCGY